MRKLRIIEHVSLDGVMQSSGEDGFPYANWTAPYRTPAGRDAMLAAHGERFRVKSQDGPDLVLSGSSTLTSTVLEHGLADEVVLAVYPVLLGTGKRFFAEGTPARTFELVGTQAMPSGIILSTYKVAGPLQAA
ncbi:MAG TPA: dihydrofolate reductase family protein [Longimicrobium sp.]|nr:dihydrofolate reductase family protein [Longimicrobium sp.]